MKVMTCPLNGPRNIQEFVWIGDVKSAPDVACSDDEWTDYLFIEDNLAGEVDEWWVHAPSNTWLIARRNRSTDDVLWTKSPAEYFADRTS